MLNYLAQTAENNLKCSDLRHLCSLLSSKGSLGLLSQLNDESPSRLFLTAALPHCIKVSVCLCLTGKIIFISLQSGKQAGNRNQSHASHNTLVLCTCSFQRGSDQPGPFAPAHVCVPPKDQCHSSLGQTSAAAKDAGTTLTQQLKDRFTFPQVCLRTAI